VASITARLPTTATASGLLPSRIAGTMNRRTTARLMASPSSDSAPRARANITTSPANSSARKSIGRRRSKSDSEYS